MFANVGHSFHCPPEPTVCRSLGWTLMLRRMKITSALDANLNANARMDRLCSISYSQLFACSQYIYILPLPIQERSCWSGVSAAFTHFDSNKFQQFFLCKFMDFWFQQISTVLNFMDFWFQQISTVFVRKFMDFLLWFRFLICHRQPSSRKRMESRTHVCHHLNAPQSKIVQVYSSNQFQSVGRMERANLWKRLGSEFVCYTLHAIYSCVYCAFIWFIYVYITC